MRLLPENKPCVIGLSLFSLAVVRNGSHLSLNGYAREEDGAPLKFWGREHHAVDIDKALSTLIASWKEIAGPFHEDGTASGSFDLSSLISTPFPPLTLNRNDTFIHIDGKHARIDLEQHSVIAVEVLLRIGEILTSMSQDTELNRAWSECRRKTDLLPFETNVGFEFRPEGEMEEETAWYAGKFEQTPEDYKRAALWLTARQRLFGILKEGEDLPYQIWKPTSLPEGLPNHDTVDVLVHRAAKAEGVDVTEFSREAIHARNLEARQIAVYRRWYPTEASTPKHR